MKRARTDKAKEERRGIILSAALDEFYEKGFSAALTDSIADRAGLSKGTVYLYFSSKEDLFKTLIESMTKPNIAALEMIASNAPTLEMALGGLAKFAPTFIRGSNMPKLLKVLVGESQSYPEILKDYKENIINRVLGLITRMLEDANHRGEISIRSPEMTAKLVVAPITFAGLWQAVFAQHDEQPMDLVALFETHVSYLLKALKTGESL
jgi:AcrR family transcriptional regulator